MTLDNLDNILLERDAGVATITINRPKVLNALNTQTFDELRRAISGAEARCGRQGRRPHRGGRQIVRRRGDINELSVQTPNGGRDRACGGSMSSI